MADDILGELRRTVTVVRDLERRHRRMLQHVVGAQEAERHRIAADIHDDTIQVITAVGLRLQMLRRSSGTNVDPVVLDRLEEAVSGAVSRLRSLVFDLEPPALDRAGLAAALRQLLDHLATPAGIRWSLVELTKESLPLDSRSILYRVAQEALSNAVRHAACSSITVTLADRGGGFELRIEDDGHGFPAGVAMDAQQPGHMGLTVMRERTELTGGALRVDSTSAGTIITAFVPSEPQPLDTSRLPDASDGFRLEIEQALLRERDFTEAILGRATSIIIVLDSEGHIVRFNAAAEKATGCAIRAVEGKPLSDVLSDAVDADTRQRFERLLRGESPVQFEGTWRCADGECRTIAWSGSALALDGDAATHVIVCGLDTTEQRAAEAARRQSDARLRLISDNSSDGIVLVAADGTIQFASRAAERMVGLGPGEGVGEPVTRFIDDDDRPLAIEALTSTAARAGRADPLALRVTRPDGTRWTAEVIANNLLDDPAVAGVVLSIRDITARVGIDAARHEREAGAEASSTAQ